MKSNTVRKLALCSLSCALVFAATLLLLPAPLVGNVNLGDCALLLCILLMCDLPTAFACATGAALADLVTGYAIYIPATFCIKLLMCLCVLGLSRFLTRIKIPAFPVRLISAFGAEAIMILGYWTYEATVLSYGWIGAAANLPFNAIQGTVALLVSLIAYPLLQKIDLFHQNNFR